MGMRECINKKLCQATCDKIELNRQMLRICRCLKEVEKTINCDHKKKKEK